MRMITRIAVLLLVVIGSCISANAVGTTDLSAYNKAIHIMEGLGILEPSSAGISAEAGINREEMAKALKNISGFSGGSLVKNSQISDVSPESSSYDAIMLATALGWMSTYEDGNFHPQDEISIEDACSAMVRLLGYNLDQNDPDFAPLILEVRQKLLKNVMILEDRKLNRGILAQIIYNAFDIELMEVVKVKGNLKYSVTADHTLLYTNLHLIEGNGIMTGNDITTLTGESKLKKGEVMINGELYESASTNADSYIGYYVDFYYLDPEFSQSGEKKLAYIEKNQEQNHTVVVDGKQLESNNSAFSNSTLVYTDEKNKIVTLSISKDADLIYNGKADLSSDLLDYRSLRSGFITLVDHNSDNRYDVIFITEYMNYVVDSVDVTEGKIYDKYNLPPLDLKENDLDTKITIEDRDGFFVSLKDLKEWYTLMVEQSKDQKVTRMVVEDNRFQGVIEEIENDEDGLLLKVNGIVYPIAESLRNSTTLSDLKVSDEGNFYINAMGEIAAIDFKAARIKNYGFVLNFMTKNGVNSEAAEIKLLTADGSVQIFDTASVVKLNGTTRAADNEKYTGRKVRMSSFFNDPALNVLIPQLITYRLNGKGEIYEINTNGYNGFKKDATVLNYQYKSTAKSFQSQYLLTNSTVIFSIPNISRGGIDEDEVSVVAKNPFVDSQLYSFDIYDLSDVNEISAIVTAPMSGFAAFQKELFLVNRVSKIITEDGSEAIKITGLFKGSEIGYTVEKNELANGIKAGDIIAVSINNKGNIDNIAMVCQAYAARELAEGQILSDAASSSTEFMKACGRVYHKSENAFTISLDGNPAPYVYPIQSDLKVYVYEPSKTKPFRIGSYNELIPSTLPGTGSLVLIYKSYYLAKSIVILK